MTTARIMTYNIQRFRGADGEANPDRILNVIADSAPDVIALQELGPVEHADILPSLAEQVGMDPFRDVQGGAAAFLSYFPLKGIQLTDLDYGGYCLRGDLDLAGKRMHLLNIRLESSPRLRSHQISRLLGPDLLGHPSLVCPVLILGDFADCVWGAGNLELAASLRRARRPLWRGTFPARLPLFGRDRAYVRGGLRILDGTINYSYLARQASSHLPLTLTVQITDTRRSLRLREMTGRRFGAAAPG